MVNGTYQLRSQVSFAGGKTVESPSITVVVRNRARQWADKREGGTRRREGR